MFRFKKSEIPFRFRFIIGNVEFDEITIYRKKVRWTERQNGTISAVNWKKGTISMVNGGKSALLTCEWTIKEAQHNQRCV